MGGRHVVIPLNVLVRVEGAGDCTRAAFLALAARVVKPSRGSVTSSTNGRAVMLPAIPVGAPRVSVLDAMQVATMPQQLAKRLTFALELNPLDSIDRISPGQLQALTLVRTLMRDPAVLFLMRPLALTEPRLRRRLQWLLRVW